MLALIKLNTYILVYIDVEKFVCLLFCFVFIKVLCLETQVNEQILVWMDDLSFWILHHQENLEFRVAWLILFLWPWKERGWGNSHFLIYEFVQKNCLIFHCKFEVISELAEFQSVSCVAVYKIAWSFPLKITNPLTQPVNYSWHN